jgi:hypothetical protein
MFFGDDSTQYFMLNKFSIKKTRSKCNFIQLIISVYTNFMKKN